MLTRKMKILGNNFLIDRDRTNIKLTLSGTSPAEIVKILRMTLASPGGRKEVGKVEHIVE